MPLTNSILLVGFLVVYVQLAGCVSGSSVSRLQQSSCNPGEASTSTGCIPCEVGFYAPNGNETQCLACPDGFTNTQPGSSECPVCKAGHGTSLCTPCPPNSYSLGNTTAVCQRCPVFKLTECALSSSCSATAGPVIEWRPEGADCRNGNGVCQNRTCVCKPGRGGADCAPCKEWTFSPGGSTNDCQPCPIPGLAPYTCVKDFFCDPVKGFGFTYLDDGASCGFAKGVCRNKTCECLAGQGGESCATCKPGFWSPGAPMPEKCRKCPKQAMCKRLKGPCEMAPPCEATTGKPTGMCWVPKPEGSTCKPRDRGNNNQTSSSSSSSSDIAGGNEKDLYYCKSGDCVPIEGDVNACELFPCRQPVDCGMTQPPICPRCKDLPPPAAINKRGRRCVCPKGYRYDDEVGCLPK